MSNVPERTRQFHGELATVFHVPLKDVQDAGFVSEEWIESYVSPSRMDEFLALVLRRMLSGKLVLNKDEEDLLVDAYRTIDLWAKRDDKGATSALIDRAVDAAGEKYLQAIDQDEEAPAVRLVRRIRDDPSMYTVGQWLGSREKFAALITALADRKWWATPKRWERLGGRVEDASGKPISSTALAEALSRVNKAGEPDPRDRSFQDWLAAMPDRPVPPSKMRKRDKSSGEGDSSGQELEA